MYECARMHIQCLAFGSFRIGNENAIEEGDKKSMADLNGALQKHVG